jgi:hypothetical protein
MHMIRLRDVRWCLRRSILQIACGSVRLGDTAHGHLPGQTHKLAGYPLADRAEALLSIPSPGVNVRLRGGVL